MDNHFSPEDHLHLDDLTWREQDILRLLAERLTNREIADRLHLAESTVKDYVSKILSKLYVKNRRTAVERAKALGLLDQPPKTSRPLSRLPAEPTLFIGRSQELAAIQQHLRETQLLTLTGPGGIGKTRLALKTAQNAVPEYQDGVFFVPLAPIRSPAHIIQTIAEALHFPIATQEEPLHQLLRYLHTRQLLLVVDNFEHLLDAARIVSQILHSSPEVKILATSREKLNLQTETTLTIAGLAFPQQTDARDTQDYDAIALFLQRAAKVRPGFDPSPQELAHITHICQIVEGMPLAIELAAAWLYILTVDEISAELTQGLDILAAEVRDTPERHRSIRTVFDHSWSLLQQTEQEVFLSLSVFRGGFTREAAQQVTGAALHSLADLVNKSFLHRDPDSGRLEVHELLRQYAHERLAQRPEDNLSAQEAHAAYYADFMQQKRQLLKGGKQMQALAEIEADIENVRAAWRYYLEQINAPQLWKLIYGLWHVYWIRGWNHGGMELFAEAVEALQGKGDEELTVLQALAAANQGYFMAWLGLAEEGYELAKESVAILQQFDHPEALVFAHDSLVVNTYLLSKYPEYIEAADKMVKVTAELDDKWVFALGLWAASLSALMKEDYSEAKRVAESALELYEEIGDVIDSTTPLIVLGHVALVHGKYKEARDYYLRCLKISEQVGFFYSTQTASKYLGKVTLSMGKITEAKKYLMQCLEITKEVGFVRDMINLLYEFARLRVVQGTPEQAAELLAFVIEHPASDHTRMLEGRIRDSAEDLLAELEGKLSPETYRTALKCGRELELDAVIADLLGPKWR
jgi:predicted ATPase/DNA-binding CsgD family transcriptional regulator